MRLDYRIIRSNRKTIALQIKPDGQLEVRCPRKMTEDAVRRFVESKASWIEKHLSQLPPQTEPKFTPAEIQQLRKQTEELVRRRLSYYAGMVGVEYNRVTVRCQRTRWGSCSGKGNLNFNCLLALAPPQVLDYVVVHELCHRKHLNHAKPFWEEVARVLPDYKQSRAWLKQHGNALICKI